ncbi:hypothetical protein [Roseivirga misakiensis]|uniref:Uncharacterized protein n=1 Tax=Roseivirga misakiensis TaxID=1563681 RepID=A0A1E5T0W6_9BACT|nr:hypothetical protein [Roseivirga misakiensis]OEK05014.1 hypothetical protein BFP71_16465 [Roseivirga misakiensis]
MSLTTDQIAQIKKFINSRGFTHIEVEMEILDHVASAVEDKLEQNPNISIEKAIREVHASFGIFGFSTIQDQKSAEFSRILKKQFWQELKSFFTAKRGGINVIILLSMLILIQLKGYLGIYMVSYIPFLLVVLASLAIGISSHWKFRKWKRKSLMLTASLIPLYLFQPQMGNFISILTRNISETDPVLAGVFLMSSSYVLLLLELSCYYTIQWGYKWTYDRYLKYT